MDVQRKTQVIVMTVQLLHNDKLLTLGAHAQRGLQQLSRVCVCVCVCVCPSVRYPYSGKPSTEASYQRFQRL